MTDMDIVEFCNKKASENNVKFSEKTLNGNYVGNGYNPYLENKTIVILSGNYKRI